MKGGYVIEIHRIHGRRSANGRTVHDKVWLVDFADPDNSDWLAVNQFSITEGKNTRRPDVICSSTDCRWW
jgi:type I site-specific restriction-modification system R (restriction) subunit